MKKTYIVLTLFVCLFAGSQLIRKAGAADCPTGRNATPVPNRQGPLRGSTVFWYPDNLPDLLQEGVALAFGRWANATSAFAEPCIALTWIQADTDAAANVIHMNADPNLDAQENAAGACIISTYGISGDPIGIRITFRFPSTVFNADQANLPSFETAVEKFAIHEIGHVMALNHQSEPQIKLQSVMNHGIGIPNDTANNIPLNVASCDTQGLHLIYPCPTPTPTPTPTPRPTPPPGTCGGVPPCQTGLTADPDSGLCSRSLQFINRCENGYDDALCRCITSPIIIDIGGNGFNLTDQPSGVDFDLESTGTPERYAWTDANNDDAWLALDRNGNGRIDNGQELFGDVTDQPTPPAGVKRNGFLALAVYDTPGKGGNGDGKINRLDSIFNQLRLWVDRNHNGISEPAELFTLPLLSLAEIDLAYTEVKVTDAHGNMFRYRARVRDSKNVQANRWAWDVFLR